MREDETECEAEEKHNCRCMGCSEKKRKSFLNIFGTGPSNAKNAELLMTAP